MKTNESIEKLIIEASSDPLNPEKNFWIAVEYEKLGQTAAAVSFYLRAAEYGVDTDPLIVYSSLLRISICMNGQKDRNHTVTNVLLQAMAYLPKRPEAYFLYSRFNERSQNWQECYTFAELGIKVSDINDVLPIDVEYPGMYGLEFEKAVSGWWIGRREQSKNIFVNLLSQDISEEYRNAIIYNLSKI